MNSLLLITARLRKEIWINDSVRSVDLRPAASGCALDRLFRTPVPHRPLMGFTQGDQSDRRYLYAQSRVRSRVPRGG